MNFRRAGVAGLAFAVVLGAGWVWGASGKSSIDSERRELELRLDLSEARADALDARVSVSQQNFGDARRHLDDAQRVVLSAQTRWREVQQAERAGRLEVVLAHLRDASRLAAAFDAGAQNAIDQAVQALTSAEQ